MSYNQEFFMADYKEKDCYANNYQKGKDEKHSQKGICCVNSVCFYPISWDCDYKAKEENEKRPCCKCRFDCREEKRDDRNDKEDCKNDKKDWHYDNCECREDKDYHDDKDCYYDNKNSYDDKKNEDNNNYDNREDKKDCHNDKQNSCNYNRCCRNRCGWFFGRGCRW